MVVTLSVVNVSMDVVVTDVATGGGGSVWLVVLQWTSSGGWC